MSVQSTQRLLDLFKPPEKGGRLNSFTGTTYEFQSEFFETEILPGLFNIGVWQTKGWSSRLALERYLDESYVGVVMDGSCYHGRPSLRIDLTTHSGARGTGKQHAKVYLLHFEDCVRLVVGSANLTDKAFRANREAVVVIDCTPQKPEAASLIEAAIEGWRAHLGAAVPDGMKNALARAGETCRAWSRSKPGKEPPPARLLWGAAGISLPEEIAKAWPSAEPIMAIDVVSPFWSRTDASAPQALVERLRQRGQLATQGAKLRILADARLDSKEPEPSLPPALVEWARGVSGIALGAVAVDPSLTADEREAFPRVDLSLVRRALHAKLVLLRGSKSSLLYVGSANCTPSGWGIRRAANIEAGLILTARKADAFLPLLPPTAGREIDLAACRPTDVAYTVDETPAAPWPSFLESAVLQQGSLKGQLILTLGWRADDKERQCQVWLTRGADAPLWQGSEGSASTSVELSSAALETLLIDRELLVRWGPGPLEARFPVLVDERAKHALPLAPGVVLPGEQALLSYYQGRIRWEELFPEPRLESGPNGLESGSAASQVDTSRILAYQMREFVEALPGLARELPEVPREERAVRRALLGAVSPLALARYVRDACREGRRSGTAALFQLLELQLVVARVRAGLNGVSSEVDQAFSDATSELDGLIAEVKTLATGADAIGAFETRVRAEIRKVKPGARA